ncbi:MAG TPA: DUF3261 domain-containing protein [Gammaproteobacteria bacterium]|nr:DUF3261 domain-containing protein [Gammaproteobacteria bacterium]
MTRSLLPVLLLGTVMLAGCATPLLPGCSRLGRNGQVCLLPPSALPAMDAVHLVSVTREGQTDAFMGQLHIDADALHLAGSSLFGTGLFTLSYDGARVTVQPDEQQFPAEKLVVMLELALLPPDELRPRLHDLELVVSETAAGEVRDVSERGHLIVHIVRGGGPLAEAPLQMDVPPLKLSVKMTATSTP